MIKKITKHLYTKRNVYMLSSLLVLVFILTYKIGVEQINGQLAAVNASSKISKSVAAAQVTNIYKVCLNRKPEKTGLDFHVGLITSGKKTTEQVKMDICNSVEAQKIIKSNIQKKNPILTGQALDQVVIQSIIAFNPSSGFIMPMIFGIKSIFGR